MTQYRRDARPLSQDSEIAGETTRWIIQSLRGEFLATCTEHCAKGCGIDEETAPR